MTLVEEIQALQDSPEREEELADAIYEGAYDAEGARMYGDAITKACQFSFSNIAIALLVTGKVQPSAISRTNGNTLLILACYQKMDEFALALIATGQSNPGHLNQNGDTALIYACTNQMSEVALALIATDQSRPGHVNRAGNTALMIACIKGLSEVAMELIAMEQSNPAVQNQTGNTALMMACAKGLSEVALALIATGHSRPNSFNIDGNTALILACVKGLSEVALALIATGQSRPEHVNKEGKTALMFAYTAGLTLSEVIHALEQVLHIDVTTNMNATGFDIMQQESYKISDYLNESPDHICIKLQDSYFLASKKTIIEFSKNESYIKFGCNRAGNTPEYWEDSNIIRVPSLILSFIGLQSLVSIIDLRNAIFRNQHTNTFYLAKSSFKFPSLISLSFTRIRYNTYQDTGNDHCDPGKETTVYKIFESPQVYDEPVLEEEVLVLEDVDEEEVGGGKKIAKKRKTRKRGRKHKRTKHRRRRY